jgi:uncharacterized protein (DUF58 family)
MKQTRVLIGILLVVGLAGTLVSNRVVYLRLLIFSLLVLIFARVWSGFALRNIRFSRQTRTPRAQLGDIFDEYFEINNDSRLWRLWLEIRDESTLPHYPIVPSASRSRLLTGIGGWQARAYRGRTLLMQRGGHLLGPTRLVSGDPFGLFLNQKVIPADGWLVVFPYTFDISGFPAPPGLLSGGRAIREKSQDVTPHAAGVREYAPGDPLKRIHWPTTARRDKLMVKEFEQDPQTEVWLFLDAQAEVQAELPGGQVQLPASTDWVLGQRPKFQLPPSTMEYGVSIAASLARYYLQGRQAVGFVTAGRTFTALPADRSERQEVKILETLAYLQPGNSLSISALVAAQARLMPRGSSAVLITATTRPDLILAVRELQRRNLHPLVVMLMAETFGGPSGGATLVESLLRLKVPVWQVNNNVDLSTSLAQFAAENSSQEMVAWQKPRYGHWT